MSEFRTSFSGSVFSGPEQMESYVEALKQTGKKIVTTNGCFDLLHVGHVRYLSQAAGLGDALIVGLNSDESVRRLKGATRPLQCFEDRAEILAALRCITAVVQFEEDDPRRLLSVIRPDIHVKGGDYSGDIIEKEVVERAGGKVKFLSFVPGKSTTNLVNRMK